MPHILLVEDEQHLAFGIKFNLEAEGYTVTVAGDGPSALELVSTAVPPVDLVVLDLMLPTGSGASTPGPMSTSRSPSTSRSCSR